MEWLASVGYSLWLPVGHSPNVDVIAEKAGQLIRVQVKTSTFFIRGRYSVAICTRGGNQSWNGVVKDFSSDRCDYLFVLVADGRRWFIPATAVEGARAILLGGPKYAAYEVDPGRPLPTEIAA